MTKIRRTAWTLQLPPLEALLKLSFRASMVLAGFALLFVAAIYYGLINP